MADTIFYNVRLKRTVNPKEAFERIKKKIKPKGPTAKWNVSTWGKTLKIDFGDEKSEIFCLKFENNIADGFCKVDFPMEGELFDDEKKSEWKTLISILYSLKTLCHSISVDDDYSLVEEYLKSLKYKFGIRQLRPEETARLEKIYELGFTDYEAFLLKIFSDDTGRELPDLKNLEKSINPGIKLRDPFPEISALWETYIFETSTLKKKCIREIYKDDVKIENGLYHISYDPPAEIYTFALGVGMLFSNYRFVANTWGRGVNVTRYFKDKFVPEFTEADKFERCRLAYRFMLSVYDYCKFEFVGKEKIRNMIKEYEDSQCAKQ